MLRIRWPVSLAMHACARNIETCPHATARIAWSLIIGASVLLSEVKIDRLCWKKGRNLNMTRGIQGETFTSDRSLPRIYSCLDFPKAQLSIFRLVLIQKTCQRGQASLSPVLTCRHPINVHAVRSAQSLRAAAHRRSVLVVRCVGVTWWPTPLPSVTQPEHRETAGSWRLGAHARSRSGPIRKGVCDHEAAIKVLEEGYRVIGTLHPEATHVSVICRDHLGMSNFGTNSKKWLAVLGFVFRSQSFNPYQVTVS